jgi:hypothetical protein
MQLAPAARMDPIRPLEWVQYCATALERSQLESMAHLSLAQVDEELGRKSGQREKRQFTGRWRKKETV